MCAAAGLHCPVCVAYVIYSQCMSVSTAVASCYCALPGVWCVGEYLSKVFAWWGILCPLPPHSGGGVAIMDGRGGVVRWVAWW